MKLFTTAIDKQLFAQYSKGANLENQKVIAKIFNPYGRGTWYLINSDANDPDYIWAIVDLNDISIGSVSRNELQSIKVPPYRLSLERDTSFEPINAMELYQGLKEGKHYKKGGLTLYKSDLELKEDKNKKYWLFPTETNNNPMGIMFAKGGKIHDENKGMLENQAVEIMHHAKELQNLLNETKGVEPWVIAKLERSATDLSDVTHYLDGESKKLSDGGYMAKGGIMYKDLSQEKPLIVNDSNVESKKFKVEEIDLIRKGKQSFVGSPTINGSYSAVEIFRQFWDEEALPISEHLNVMLLNRANKVIGLYQHSKGGITGTILDPEMVVLSAVKSLAKGVIVAHNHPSGNLQPSEADKQMSKKLKEALKLVDINLLDSLIITKDSYYSLFENGYLEKGGMMSDDAYMAKGGELYGGYKIKVEKKTSPYNKDYKGIEVKVDKDGVPLKYVLQSLVDFKDQLYLDKALDDKNVQVFVKLYTRYMPLGNISKEIYKKYIESLKFSKSDDAKIEKGGYMAKGGKSQGYSDREDERLAMHHGKISNKDFVGSHSKREHSRRDDARFEERVNTNKYK